LLAGLGSVLLYLAFLLTADQYSFAASVFGFPLVAVGYACLLVAALSPAGFLSRTRWSVTSSVAAWSYGIYLTHKGVIHLTQEGLSNFGIARESGMTFLCATVASLVAAWLLHIAVERPFMGLRAMVLSRLDSREKSKLAVGRHA